jgi:hypothetical protein
MPGVIVGAGAVEFCQPQSRSLFFACVMYGVPRLAILRKFSAAYRKIVGPNSKFFRPPVGRCKHSLSPKAQRVSGAC